MNTIGKIEALEDFQVVRFFNYFSQEFLSGIDSSLEDIVVGVPDSIRQTKDFSEIELLVSEETQANLNPEQSADLARKILSGMAKDENLERILAVALDEYSDYELAAGTIIAVGVAVSMILVTATTSVEGEVFGIKFNKQTADAELVQSVTNPAAEILSTFQSQGNK